LEQPQKIFEQNCDTIKSHKDQNDLIRCNLLKRAEPAEQFAIIYCIDNIFLQKF